VLRDGQRLRHSETGAFFQKWRDNEKESRGPAAAAEPHRWAAKIYPGIKRLDYNVEKSKKDGGASNTV